MKNDMPAGPLTPILLSAHEGSCKPLCCPQTCIALLFESARNGARRRLHVQNGSSYIIVRGHQRLGSDSVVRIPVHVYVIETLLPDNGVDSIMLEQNGDSSLYRLKGEGRKEVLRRYSPSRDSETHAAWAKDFPHID